MELRLYLDILRRRWWIVAAVPLLVALISGLAAASSPPRYGLTLRLLVTRAPTADGAGLTDLGEDKTALDLPAIVGGATFRRDLAQELARQGRPIDEAALVGALQAGRQDNVVTIAVTAAHPDDAVAIGQAVVALIKANGLRYWGDPRATPEQPGLNVGVLDPPEQAALLNGPRAIVTDVALRALLGLVAAVGVAFALHYLEVGHEPRVAEVVTNDQPSTTEARGELSRK
jgi:capsular polysaccharide biosynthesis protein